MAIKGTVAKDNVMKALQEAFGKDFIGIYDKKGYIWADDGGARVQVAVSLTCPKTPVGEVQSAISDEGYDFEEASVLGVAKFDPVDFTQEEIDKINKLVEKLDLD